MLDAGGQRAAPALARRARVQGPLQHRVGPGILAAAHQDLVAAVALRGLHERVGAERAARGVIDRDRHQADRQAALGGHALELGARRVLRGAIARRRQCHQRERTHAVPDAAADGAHRLLDRGGVEHHLRLAAGTCGVALHVLGRIGDQAGERRVVG